jgi:hypothetical protein
MKGLQRLSTIRNLSKKDPTWVHKDVFRILKQNDLWITAYENLKGNKEALTPGATEEGGAKSGGKAPSRSGYAAKGAKRRGLRCGEPFQRGFAPTERGKAKRATPPPNPQPQPTETLDDMSLDRLTKLKEAVISETYRFTAVKRTYIPQPDGRLRPLGLPSENDKIVQEVIRMILEVIFEPSFSDLSFGFRSGLGCHDALKHVEKTFRWVDFVIEGDIEQAYPSINHKVLVNKCLKRRIHDERFINLIWKSLKCGVLDRNAFKIELTGIPQSSIVAERGFAKGALPQPTILANIYYNQLDSWVKSKAAELGAINHNRRSPAYKKIEHQISSLIIKIAKLDRGSPSYKNQVKEIKLLRKQRVSTPSMAEPRIKIEYVRYADDWIIGVAGDEALARRLKKEVGNFILEELQQTIHPLKTRITNLRKGKASFLGYEIYLPSTKALPKYKGKQDSSFMTTTQTIRRGNPMLRFDLPQDRVIKRLTEKGYLSSKKNGIRPISRAGYAVLEDHVIVTHFRNLTLGLNAYYSGVTRPDRLQYINYLLHMSCAMTLGHRHRMSCSKVFKKYGKTLTVQVPSNPGVSRSFPYKTSWRISEKHWKNGKQFEGLFSIYANQVSKSALGQNCLVCDSNISVEMHHVNNYSGLHKERAILNRKQVPAA